MKQLLEFTYESTTQWWVTDDIFVGALGLFGLFLRETVVSMMIHGRVLSVTLYFGVVVGAADV